MSALLMNVFIGRGPLHTRIWENIVYRNVSSTIFLLHIASKRGAKELFNIAGLNPAEYENRSGRKYAMCGKLLIRWKNNNVEDIAYVINKRRNRLFLQTTGNQTGTCSKPKFLVNDENNGRFDLESVTDGMIGGRPFTIKEYRPIRIRLDRNSSVMRITTNRLVYNEGINDTLELIGNECS